MTVKTITFQEGVARVVPGGALPSPLNLRECIVSVLRDNPEVRNIGGLADHLETAVMAWADSRRPLETAGAA